jgi:hypothetical protein
LRIVVNGGVGSSRAETLLGFLSQVNVAVQSARNRNVEV